MPDVESALLTFLGDLGWTTTVTPPNLPAVIAAHGCVIRVRRIGGGGDVDNDEPIISLQVMAADTTDAPRATHNLAGQVEDLLLGLSNSGPAWVDGTVLESPAKTSGPIELPYPDPTVTVVESIYRLTTRR